MSKASGSLNPCKIFLKNNKFFFLSAWIRFYFLFLFFPNLSGPGIGNHPQEHLPRFGYTSQRKAEMFRDFGYRLATCWTTRV
jgi:hypothetical protein